MRRLIWSFLAALLPWPERDRLARCHEVDPGRSSLVLGYLEGTCGLVLFFAGWITFTRASTGVLSVALLESWFPGLLNTHFMGAGLVSGLSWLVHPIAWVTALTALIGLVRIVAYVAAREAIAEPVVWAGLRAYQLARRGWGTFRRTRTLGPPRPDRLKRPRPGELIILTCREKPEWNERVTIEVHGRHYRLTGVEEREDNPWTTIAYRMRLVDDNAVIRRLVHYE